MYYYITNDSIFNNYAYIKIPNNCILSFKDDNN